MARRKRRVLTWVILVMNVLFLIWIIAGIAGNSDNCAGKVGDDLDLCRAATDVGSGIAVFAIVIFAGFMNVILGVIWLVTRKSTPAVAAAPPPAMSVPRAGNAPTGSPAQWAPDPTRRHELRWWDGSRWTEGVSDRGVQSMDPIADGAPTQPVQASASRTCPFCAETILAAAKVCKHCGRDLPAPAHPAGTCQECGTPIPSPQPEACPRCREPYIVTR